jgi:pimeloyl-ACP methyl ester carboxylesterase
MALADEGFLDIEGARLEYRMIGPRPDAAPTIVMLHEGLGSAALWGDFPERLARRTKAGVFVYSRAGYGRSSPVALPRPLDYMQREATEVMPKLLVAFRGWNDAWLDPGFADFFDIVEPLAYIRVPVLIVQGEDDPYGTVRQIEVAEEECYCPVDAVLLPGCGHAPHRDKPDETLEAVGGFIERILVLHGEAKMERAA